MSEAYPGQQAAQTEDYWRLIAMTPELGGFDRYGREGLNYSGNALLLHVLAAKTGRVVTEQVNATMMAGSEAIELGSTDAENFYKIVDNWYRLQGSTNDLQTGFEMNAIGAAPELERLAKGGGESAFDMQVLAADLYHEVAILYHGVDAEIFNVYYESAKDAYRQVVVAPIIGKSMLSEISGNPPASLTPERAKQLMQATFRYRDLRFLGLHAKITETEDDNNGLNDRDEELARDYRADRPHKNTDEEERLIRGYRIQQDLAINDFQAAIDLSENTPRGHQLFLTPGDLSIPFRVLAERNEQMFSGSLDSMLSRVSAATMRNPFPREAEPLVDMPSSLPSFAVDLVVDRYDRTGRTAGSERLVARPNMTNRPLLPEIKQIQTTPDRRQQIDIKNLKIWSMQLRKILAVQPERACLRWALRDRRSKLPFDPYL